MYDLGWLQTGLDSIFSFEGSWDEWSFENFDDFDFPGPWFNNGPEPWDDDGSAPGNYSGYNMYEPGNYSGFGWSTYSVYGSGNHSGHGPGNHSNPWDLLDDTTTSVHVPPPPGWDTAIRYHKREFRSLLFRIRNRSPTQTRCTYCVR